jgi:hypothetical protein
MDTALRLWQDIVSLLRELGYNLGPGSEKDWTSDRLDGAAGP